MLATALPVCGFDIPDEETLHLQKDGGCSVSIQNKINYAQLDYLFFYKNKSIDKLLSDDLFFFKEEEKYYFVNEEIDDPKVTIKTPKDEAASPISIGTMHGYVSRSEHFVQDLPGWNAKDQEVYSFNLSCMTMAVGNEKQSFKTRFCTPHSRLGDKQMTTYKGIMTEVRPAP